MLIQNNLPNILISGSYNLFNEGFNAAGVYAFSGMYTSETLKLPIYVGGAENLQKRIETDHISALNGNRHTNKLFQNDWNEHGPESFVVWCLNICKREKVFGPDGHEQYYLDTIRPFLFEGGGFNINPFASKPPSRKGIKLTEEHKIKIRESGKGKPYSEERKRKIREALTGRKHTGEARAKMRKSHLGVKLSEEHKRNAANAHRGLKRSEKTKARIRDAQKKTRYRVISPDFILYEGEGISQFCREYNLNQGNFSELLIGKRKSHKGWRAA
jgi:group I intron endonuclease